MSTTARADASTTAASPATVHRPILDAFTDRVTEPARHHLQPGLTMLNGASYGVVPEVVRDAQRELHRRIELDPVRFYKYDLERYSDDARQAIARLVNCDAADLALVPNGTVAMSSVILNLALEPGDEVVVTNHEYQATINELTRVTARAGARIVVAKVPFPRVTPDDAVAAIEAAITPRTRLVIVSHIASATSLLMPVERIVPLVKNRGIDILVDGAHAPGQIAIDLHALSPTYYAASCHKWLGASKGTGFLYADPERQKRIKPVAMSCRTHLSRPERKAFLCDFDYVGTEDPTGNLVLPVAIAHLSAQHPGGLAGLQRRNHDTVMAGTRLVADAAGVEQPVPECMTASMMSLCLPVPATGVPKGRLFDDALWDALLLDHNIQAPCWGLAGVHPRLMRVSCQWHNTMADFERLAGAIAILLRAHGGATGA